MLLLVVVGSVIGRIGVKREVEAATGDGADGGSVDFDALLAELLEELRVLGADMQAAPDADQAARDGFKIRIETLQLEKFERLVAAQAAALKRA